MQRAGGGGGGRGRPGGDGQGRGKGGGRGSRGGRGRGGGGEGEGSAGGYGSGTGRGGGERGGRGRGGGDGRGGRGRGVAAPMQQTPPPATASTPSFSAPSGSASSAAEEVASLSRVVEQRLTIGQEPTAAAAAPPAAGPLVVPPSTPAVPLAVVPRTVAPVSSKSIRPPHRPGYGTAGWKCVVRANHLLVQLQTQKQICHYDVAITPEVPSRAVNRAIMHELVVMYRESHLGKRLPVYDGRKSLYTAGPMPFTSKEFTIELKEKNKSNNLKSAREFRVAIKLVGNADVYHLSQFMEGKQLDEPHEAIHALDVVLRESASLNYITVSRSFFSSQLGQPVDIGDGIECWRGFYQSLRPTQMGLSLNIDISATSFYKSQLVVEFAAEYLHIRDVSKPLSDTERVKIKKALRGLRVEVTHRPGTIRRYRISGISAVPMNQLTFAIDDQSNSRVSVVEYFWQRYNVRLKYVNWPCLQSGADNRPTYLPMEVCKIVDGQRYAKKLNEHQVAAMLKATCKRPRDRAQNIVDMASHNNYGNDEFVKEFGIRVHGELTTIEARVLDPPLLKYHESGLEKQCKPSVGQWNMIKKRMVNGGTLKYWACLNLSRLNPNMVNDFCYDLVAMCQNIGMNVEPHPMIEIYRDRPENLDKALVEVHRRCANRLVGDGEGKYLQLLIVVLPERSGSYGQIKRICETELGIVSQCCQPKNVSKYNNQYLENVSLKINVKVNGRNTVLVDAISNKIPLVTDRPTIIFGADVTHPMPGEDSSPSIAAVVASMDWPEITKYRGLLSAQLHRQEIIKDLYTEPDKDRPVGGMIRDHLIAFWRKTNLKPQRIIFYRDGVSEGQFNEVLLHEMDAIRKACQSLQQDYLPPVTFVVVQKRHHTRFFPFDFNSRQSTDRSGNILPGTVVDTKICHPTQFDFYLCSHAGIQGTSRPTHYHVLYDENGFSADALQILTNKLCYTYARCTRAVSVVPPAYYAHLAAFRARYYIEGESDRGSSSAESSSRARLVEGYALPKVKDIVKESMFFC